MMQQLERSQTTTIPHQQCSCPNLTRKSSHTAVVKALKTTKQIHSKMKLKMIIRYLLKWSTLPNLKFLCLQTLRLNTLKLRIRTQKKKKHLRKGLHRLQMRLRQDLLYHSLRLEARKETTNYST